MNARAVTMALSSSGVSWLSTARELAPGLLASAVLAVAAAFLSQHYGAPVMLLSLLLGMAMNFLSSEGACVSGIEFTVRTVLRCGVALLALRITLAQVAELGWQPVTLVLLSVMLTIGSGIVAARALGFRTGFGLLSGGATAICGASAALAIAAALPNHPLKERASLLTVLGVSALSSLAMITYPLLTHVIGLDAKQAGVFLGATIHDVAQVVGAGYSISPETGDVATLVKLFRVAMLMPVIAITVMSYRHAGAEPGVKRPPPLPGFVVVFAGFALLHSFDVIPSRLVALGSDVSQWCLVAAVAALGTKTRLRELAGIGLKPIALMFAETLFLMLLVLALLRAQI
jgi:uncharacterized integral membrane protein (TIGR00698 family)